MSAAKPLPKAGVTHNIAISAGGSIPLSSQALQISAYDDFDFTNNSGITLSIVFNTQFPTITLAPGTKSSANGGNGAPLNLTVSYNIYNQANPTTSLATGCVQFGNGPLTIKMTAQNLNPPPFRIPNLGSIQIVADATYTVGWTFASGGPANVWTPVVNPVQPGTNPVQNAGPGASNVALNYKFPATLLTQGGGTVKTGSGS